MSQAHAVLLRALVDDYGLLRARLARRLGFCHGAGEVLQEAYLRLGRTAKTGMIFHPRTYLFRLALNIAADRRRSEKRRLARQEIELLLRVDQDELDPERIAQGKSSVRLLVDALKELPSRRRAILVASRVEALSIPEIAARFGVSTRF